MANATFGTLLKSEPMATAIPGATSRRVLYSSKDVTGVPHAVSGLVVAPAEPGADRPLLSWCHGTTGLGDAGCPSALPDPTRELTIYLSSESTAQIDYGIPGLAEWIAAGFVVCVRPIIRDSELTASTSTLSAGRMALTHSVSPTRRVS
jgi:hypothetical protein